MKVLVLFSSNPGSGFLVKLNTQELICEIKRLISKRYISKAMVTAMAKGRIEREVGHFDVHNVDADLILTKDRVSWNVIK